jgi:Cu/Ag efflux pump CusA
MVIMLGGVLTLPLLGESLFPEFKERDFLMHWITKPGTSGGRATAHVHAGEPELRAIPGVRNFGSHIGQALLADEVNGVNFAENWISVDPKVDYDETVEAIEATVTGYPGMFHNVETYLNESIDEVITGSKETFDVRVYGPGPRTRSRPSRTWSRTRCRASRASRRSTSSSSRRSPRSRSKWISRRHSATASSRAMSAARPPR